MGGRSRDELTPSSLSICPCEMSVVEGGGKPQIAVFELQRFDKGGESWLLSHLLESTVTHDLQDLSSQGVALDDR
ncbi:Uncharacterised protein [Mycobacterium tuberculosis]|nr:Uncharacterised protein [Mycobacterium tuberculosis]